MADEEGRRVLLLDLMLDERGQDLVEYGLLASLLAVAVAVAIIGVSRAISERLYAFIEQTVGGWASAS